MTEHHKKPLLKTSSVEFGKRYTWATSAPQGTLISPVLFPLHTNDLRASASVNMVVFADDTAFVYTSNSPAHFEEEAKKLHQWCKEHFLQINVRKTKELLIDLWRKAAPAPQLTINTEDLDRVSSYTCLRTAIDSNTKTYGG